MQLFLVATCLIFFSLNATATDAFSADPLCLGSAGSPVTPQILLQTSQNLAPCVFQVGGGYFNGIRDDVLMWGFNAARDGTQLVPDVAKFNLQMETDYYCGGRHWLEYNLDFIGTDNVTYRRFMMFYTDRDDPDAVTQWEFSIAGSGSFSVNTPCDQSQGPGQSLFAVNADGQVIVPGTLTVGSTLGVNSVSATQGVVTDLIANRAETSILAVTGYVASPMNFADGNYLVLGNTSAIYSRTAAGDDWIPLVYSDGRNNIQIGDENRTTVVGGRLSIGGGIPIQKFISAADSWDPPTVPSGGQTTTTIPVSGARVGDTVLVSLALDLEGMQLTGYVSSAGVVTVVLRNGTQTAIDLNLSTLRADVWQH